MTNVRPIGWVVIATALTVAFAGSRLVFFQDKSSKSAETLAVGSKSDANSQPGERAADRNPGALVRTDIAARVGVVSLTPDLIPLAEKKLPLGFFKDYTCFDPLNRTAATNLSYMPVIQYKSKADSFAARALVSLAWRTGQMPKLPGTKLNQLLTAMELGKLEKWIVEATGKGIPDGTMFLLGNEPGYRPNRDDRSPKEIVADAVAIKQLFKRHNLTHQLALGGISTPNNRMSRDAYGGPRGTEFFRAILEEAGGKLEFDGFVVHPYPSDLDKLSAQESYDQIVEFRRIMKSFGQRDKPVYIGEVGLPFRAVQDRRGEACRYTEDLVFLCLTGRDKELGNPTDDNRLIQRITWFLLSPPTVEIPGFTDLADLDLSTSALMQADGTLTDIGLSLVRAVDRAERASQVQSVRWSLHADGQWRTRTVARATGKQGVDISAVPTLLSPRKRPSRDTIFGGLVPRPAGSATTAPGGISETLFLLRQDCVKNSSDATARLRSAGFCCSWNGG